MANRAYLRHLEQLFLIEVLVERVDVEKPCCIPVKVRVQFIDLLPFDIDQEEFRAELDAAAASVEASAAAAAEMGLSCPDTCIPLPEPPGKVATGKSCLFPMLPLELIKCLKRYPLIMSVFRVMGECCEGDILDHLGTAYVSLALPHYCDTIRRSTICGEKLPLVACMSGVYPLYAEDDDGRNRECGSIELMH